MKMLAVRQGLRFFGNEITGKHQAVLDRLVRLAHVSMKRTKNTRARPAEAETEASLVEDSNAELKRVKTALQNEPTEGEPPGMDISSKKEGLNLRSLRDRGKKMAEITEPIVKRIGGKIRATVDMKMMKEELKQLEDPPSSPLARQLSGSRLGPSFFDTPCEELAQSLLGKILVRRLDDGIVLKGKIVETEGYLGAIDKASHSYQSKMTARNIPMFMPPGTIYVYMTYGMYHCFNLSSQGEGCAVLIRALEPVEGMERMAAERNAKAKSKKDLKMHELCNGPSKLCMALRLDKTHSKYSICSWKGLWIEKSDHEEEIKIVKCSRIGIESSGAEWAGKPLRYYIYGNKYISKRDKKAEASLEIS